VAYDAHVAGVQADDLGQQWLQTHIGQLHVTLPCNTKDTHDTHDTRSARDERNDVCKRLMSSDEPLGT
jgi:hypothetical protein